MGLKKSGNTISHLCNIVLPMFSLLNIRQRSTMKIFSASTVNSTVTTSRKNLIYFLLIIKLFLFIIKLLLSNLAVHLARETKLSYLNVIELPN